MGKHIETKNKKLNIKKYKKKNISQLIKIIFSQNERITELLKKVEEMESYLQFIEEVYMPEDEEGSIAGGVFEADDEFEHILQEQLRESHKYKIEELKKEKEKDKDKDKKPKLYTIEEILKVFKDE